MTEGKDDIPELSEIKDDEIIIKKDRQGQDINIDLADYRAFISFGLIAITAYFAYIGNEAWREFAIMASMAVAYWFKRDGGNNK